VKKIIVSLLIVSFFISSCAHSYSIENKETKLQFFDRVNKLCAGHKDLILKTKDGGKIKVNSFTLSPDSTIYSEFELGTVGYIKTDELSQIEFRSQSKLGKIFLGMGFGAVAALPVSLLMILIFNRNATGDQAMGNLGILLYTFIGCVAIGLGIAGESGPDIIKL
jgi:hypothetical protein